MSLRAISVDVDDTLYRVRKFRVLFRLWSDRTWLGARVRAREKIRAMGPADDEAELLRREIDLVSADLGRSVNEVETGLRRVRAGMPAALTEGVRPFPGVRAFLEAAQARGLSLCALSDYPPNEKIERLGLADLDWRIQLGAQQTGALKPHARPFQRLLAELGCAPSEVLHIGDREDLDVRGALDAGLRAWRFARGGAADSRAERVFRRWDPDLLKD